MFMENIEELAQKTGNDQYILLLMAGQIGGKRHDDITISNFNMYI